MLHIPRLCISNYRLEVLALRGQKEEKTLLNGKLARPRGFEPPTPGTGIRCSIHLSYGRAPSYFNLFHRFQNSECLIESIFGIDVTGKLIP